MKKFKSVLAMLLALIMLLSCVASAFAATDKTGAEDIAETEKPAATLRQLKGYKSESFLRSNSYKYAADETVRAIVILSGDPEADIAERGTERAVSQRTKLMRQHESVRKSMSGIKYELAHEFTALTNGFSCDVAYGDLDQIAALDGVEAVYIANRYASPELVKEKETRMASSNAFFTGIDDSYSYYGADGTGMVIAVLDTGLNTTHEAFADADGNCANYGVLTEGDISAAAAPGVYINAKVPFAYDYADLDNDVTDYEGHGTHVSGIATGCAYDEGEGAYTFLGAASGAQLVSMKIFHDDEPGTSSDIYFAALEDAYRLGVDVVNMSIGSQNGFTYDSELETVVFGNIYRRLANSGIVMSVAAGNEYSMAENSAMGYIGPEYQDYGTVASPATYEGNVSVASVENYLYLSYILTTDAGSFAYTDSSDNALWLSTFGGKTADYVIVPDPEDPSSISYGYEEDYDGVDVAGKIAVIQRGDITFEEKVEFAANAGAIGCIVVNNQPGTISMAIETFEIPAVSVEQSAADALIGASEYKVETPDEKQYVENANAGLMSDFSNWGTSPMLTLDPAVTSVGGMIYSSMNTGDADYDVLSGTSMATPNFAGTIATVMQYLGEVYGLEKKDRADAALALLESTAEILYDEYGYPYSPRKQGAGLANACYALDTMDMSGYILNPLQELGDDAKRTGHYTFTAEIRNDSTYDLFYLPETYLMYDYVYDYYEGTEDEPLYINDLSSDYLYYGNEGYAEVTYEIGGADVADGFTLAAGESASVQVDILLDADIMDYFDEQFVNGNYVEGYVIFNDIETDEGELVYFDEEDNAYKLDEVGAYLLDGETYEPILDGGERTYYEGDAEDLGLYVYSSTHATLLAYYGDWTDGDVLESCDFRDLIDAEYFVNTEVADEDGYTYADYGYTGADLLEFYTSPNMAYSAIMFFGEPYDLVWYLGDNLYDYVAFYEEHVSITTDAADGDGYYANGFYLEPYQLRNCRNLIMTIMNAETGEVYFVDNTEYLPKSFYDEEGGAWMPMGAFYWDGTDADGEFVPSGTVVNVNFDAVLPYEHANDKDGWEGTLLENVWNFNILVDSTAPVIESAEFDKGAQTVTVTASDESYLANIVIGYPTYDEEWEEYTYEDYDWVSLSSDEAGASFTATFDVSELVEAGFEDICVSVLDYATNVSETYVALNACDHTNTEIRDAVAAGCETEGYSGDTYCADCGEFLFAGETIEPTGHHFDTGVISKQPTCTEEGERTHLCPGCGSIYTTVIAAYGHAFGEWTVTKPATATTKGEESRACANCETVETREIPAKGYSKCYVESFTDCPDKWYHEAIDFVVEAGLMDGTGLKTFAPKSSMTRAMIVTVLYRMESSPEVTALSSFKDVAKDAWYAEAVSWAQDTGVVTGYSDDKFGPEDNVTREQIATILWRYENRPESTADLSEFKDADKISAYAEDAMNWAVAEGILNGDNGNLKPKDNATRAEFACMIMRYFGGSYECESMKNWDK